MDGDDIIKIAAPLLAISATGLLLFRHHFASHNHANRLLTFRNLDECVVELENIVRSTDLKITNNWTLFQNLVHCTQSIAFSMTGYPENKSAIFHKTIGTMVFHQFQKQGYMRHDRNEPLPGAMPIQPEGNVIDAATTLKNVITDFENYKAELKPHFAFGNLTKSEFAKAHCMHLADHFAIMTY